VAEALAAVGLGQVDAQQAHLGKALQDRRSGRLAAALDLLRGLAQFAGGEAAHRLLQRPLLFGKTEIHLSRSPLASLFRPARLARWRIGAIVHTNFRFISRIIHETQCT
jgi:hypothetical protein